MDTYSHFTSPMRRIADLINHFCLKYGYLYQYHPVTICEAKGQIIRPEIREPFKQIMDEVKLEKINVFSKALPDWYANFDYEFIKMIRDELRQTGKIEIKPMKLYLKRYGRQLTIILEIGGYKTLQLESEEFIDNFTVPQGEGLEPIA